ncbi:MAG TPA: aminotransferase class V-fold PLP-dependent enzyme [Vicinamibacterales bacterium]
MRDWRAEWFEFDDAVYLNSAAEGLMPRVAVRAVEQAIEAKKFPHRSTISATAYLGVQTGLRATLATLVGGRPEEIALTTGASAGTATLAYGIAWKPGDEVLTSTGEFPLQYTTWAPLAERDGVALRAVAPAGPFLTAADLIAALTPRTRLVSVSLVRFNDGSMLDAAPLAAACHAQGTLLCLDVSQCCGAVPLDAAQLGADFLTCAGYKWLLSPYGTGFFWARAEHLQTLRPGPFYWMATDGADDFSSLKLDNPKPAPAARRWDTPEWAGAFNPNLAGMAAAAAFVERIGPPVVRAHVNRLVDQMLLGLPRQVVEPASPLDATRRGPFGCFRGHTPAKTREIYERLSGQNVVVSLREGNIRVAPYLFNTKQDVDRLLDVVSSVPPSSSRMSDGDS